VNRQTDSQTDNGPIAQDELFYKRSPKTVGCLCVGLRKSAKRVSPQLSGSGMSGQSLIDYLGTHLRVTYVRSAAARVSDVILTNSGPLDIPPGARTTLWSIYFSHATYGKRKELKRQDVKCRTGKR